MKIKRARKIITLMLVLLLAAQLTSIASAATVTWKDSNGYTYSATVSKGVGSTQKRIPVPSTETCHNYGKVESIKPGMWYVSATGDMTFPSAYASKLQSAASNENLGNFKAGTVSLEEAFNIPAASASGYYCLGTHFNGNKGTYRVEKIGSSSTNVIASGSFSFAPYACTGDRFLYAL